MSIAAPRRLLVVVPLALLAAALAADFAWGQLRPGQPGGPRPPGPPAPGGLPGPRLPGVPGAGGNPWQPAVPPFVPPGRPQVPRFERVWSCSNCGRELVRGGGTPALATCPFCGARFANGTRPWAPGGGPAPAAGQMVPAEPAAGAAAPLAVAGARAAGGQEKSPLQSTTFLVTVGVGAAVWGGLVAVGTALVLAGRSRSDAPAADGH